MGKHPDWRMLGESYLITCGSIQENACMNLMFFSPGLLTVLIKSSLFGGGVRRKCSYLDESVMGVPILSYSTQPQVTQYSSTYDRFFVLSYFLRYV